MSGCIRGFLRRALTRRIVWDDSPTRHVKLHEDVPPERLKAIILLMVVFFASLVILELVHLVWQGTPHITADLQQPKRIQHERHKEKDGEKKVLHHGHPVSAPTRHPPTMQESQSQGTTE